MVETPIGDRIHYHREILRPADTKIIFVAGAS